MDFEGRKAAMLNSLGSSATDKSPKGTLDTPIIPLLNTLNSHPSYFTTSSCSGRISILSHPNPSTVPPTNKKKARGGSWIFISHDPANPDSVLPLLFPPSSEAPIESTELVFRFEPLIIAVECKDVESAQFLVSLAISAGFRESGITSANKKRVIVGIRCSIRMEVPLGPSDGILVSPGYVRFLVCVANEKMEANRKRTLGFLTALKDNGFVGPAVDENGDRACNDDDDDDNGQIEDERTNADGNIGSIELPGCSLSSTSIEIVGEPVERLFLWGHSTCMLDHGNDGDILVFGGFGGLGRHARRNDCLVLNTLSGMLKPIKVDGAPSPRLGHTASLVGDCVFIIGGRADPLNILSDVWILDTAKMGWKLLECTGSLFPPRHRHAAAVVGSNIYIFGGLNNEQIFSSLHVLNSTSLQWKEVTIVGEQPPACHSHSMVGHGSKIFMFGGYNGEKALGDLYSFDVQTCIWKKIKTAGRSPNARFSHSMFVYKNFLGVIGGCPVRQHFQELALLDLQYHTWNHVTLNFIGEELLVRSTTNVVGDDLVMIGGGAACYAFGTKFSKPLKINLLPLMSIEDKVIIPLKIEEKHANNTEYWVRGEKNVNIQDPQFENKKTSTQSPDLNFEAVKEQLNVMHWVVQLERKYAKLGKDLLKKFGWLDLGRKVYSKEDGLHICFPVTAKFCTEFPNEQQQCEAAFERQNGAHDSKLLGIVLSEVSCSAALKILKEFRATKVADGIVEVRRTVKSPLQVMNEAVASLIKSKGLSEKLLEQLPTRWERLGDIVVLPVTSFRDPVWDKLGKELWLVVARSLNSLRLARQGRVAPTGTRDSTLEILVGDDGWVDHRENGILYSFDSTKCMFSWGNLSEKLRMGNLDCNGEVVVDLFAGIGYFVLPFLVRAKAKLVYACEWNPHALEALKRNLDANSVSDRCVVLKGDNRITAPKGVADRVCLGLLPTSEASWVTAIKALRSEGGMLHVHGNVKDLEEDTWSEYVVRSLGEIARSEGHCWNVAIEHIERVKWYAPHVRHLVADVKCRHILR